MKIVAKSLVFDKDKKILVLQRSGTHPNYAHHFDFPGGEVEDGEIAVEAVSREIFEETGLIIDIASVKQVYEKQIDENLIHIVCIANYNHSQPDIKLSWEHQNYEWLNIEELLKKQIPRSADDYYLTAIKYITSTYQQKL